MGLLGYDLKPTELRPGEKLSLTLYWQGLGPTDRSYTVFVHLLNKEGEIHGQRDGMPANGALPTTGWVQGEVIIDGREIPVSPETPPGMFTLALGMYDASTGERLPVLDAEGLPLGDRLTLAEVELRAE